MSILQDYQRVSRRHRCPICDKDDWCLVSRDDAADPARVICARHESPIRCGSAGWLHVRRDRGQRSSLRTRALRFSTTRQAVPDRFERLHQQSLADHRIQLRDGLAASLGLSQESFRRLQVGWGTTTELSELNTRCSGDGCWTFPMFDGLHRKCGIRLRSVDGSKYAVKGSRQGLFVPDELAGVGPLLISEGPTDTAALLDCGFDAIGRPSCTGHEHLVMEFVKGHGYAHCVIAADADDPGRSGAEKLAAALLLCCPTVRVIAPPAGLKDVRAWRQAGATQHDIRQAIDAAPVRRLRVRQEAEHGR